MTTILLTNPHNGATFERDITGLTEAELDAYAMLMDDDLREALHADLAPCTPEAFLAAYADRVGPEAAGMIVLGS